MKYMTTRCKFIKNVKHETKDYKESVYQYIPGNFADVYRARYTDPDRGVQMVAVKISKGKYGNIYSSFEMKYVTHVRENVFIL
jgi:hypothetical protein